MNKDITELKKELKKQGAEFVRRKNGLCKVIGPSGFYLLHESPSAGMNLSITKKRLRAIGFKL